MVSTEKQGEESEGMARIVRSRLLLYWTVLNTGKTFIGSEDIR